MMCNLFGLIFTNSSVSKTYVETSTGFSTKYFTVRKGWKFSFTAIAKLIKLTANS